MVRFEGGEVSLEGVVVGEQLNGMEATAFTYRDALRLGL